MLIISLRLEQQRYLEASIKALENMKPSSVTIIIHLLTTQCLFHLCASGSFDFFYFVQQWPGSYCDRKSSCCYPTTGKPAANFSIHGLWPNFNNGSYPSSCNSRSLYNEAKISDLISSMQKNWPTLACPSKNGSKFWAHEWQKHGTCSESILDQHGYFEAALKIKHKVDLLKILQDAGIHPDGKFYSLEAIKDALKGGTGYAPGVECNRDASGNNQLFQIYLCVDKSGSDLINCPVVPKRKCNSTIEFPPF